MSETENFQTVVVELVPSEELAVGAQQMALLKASFFDDATEVIYAIGRLGGSVTGLVWLNRTIRCDMPPDVSVDLEALPGVAAVGTPRRLILE